MILIYLVLQLGGVLPPLKIAKNTATNPHTSVSRYGKPAIIMYLK